MVSYVLIIELQSTGVGQRRFWRVHRPSSCMSCCSVWYGDKTYKCHVNRMMFVWITVSSRWHYQYDTVLMHGCIQGDIVYMCDEFGVHGKLYVEVIRTSCFMAKHENGSDHDTQHVWHGRKLLITFDVQGLRMILSELEVCGVQSVSGVCSSTRHGNGSKWEWNGKFESKWLTSCWSDSLVPQCFLCVWSWYICIPNVIHVCACRRRGLDF